MDPQAASDFGELLRTRRARLTPADVGLTSTRARRTPGLRREEVALLADVSVTYYSYLEQGRRLTPSASVIDSLARALRFTAAELVYARALVASPGDALGSDEISADVVALVHRLVPDPTYVKGPWWDILAANASAEALFTRWSVRPVEDRNMLVWMLTDPQARDVYVDWADEARAMLARFRSELAAAVPDPRGPSLINRLLAESGHMRDWWPLLDVGGVGSGVKRLRDGSGDATYRHLVLRIADAPQCKLVTFTRAAD